MRRLMSVILFTIACGYVNAQDDSEIEAVLHITGSADVEEIDEYEYERLSRYFNHPLRLNHVSASGLASSGLMTPYQAASLVDYRLRHGDVMSFSELSAIDGFGAAQVEMLKPFVSLEGGNAVLRDDKGIRNGLAVRSGVKQASPWTYGLKYGLETSGGLSAGVALSRTLSAVRVFPDAYSVSLEWEPKRIPVRILAGDYNARFGQGLALYNGMSMSGLTSPSSFLRRASGYSRTDSFTGTYAMTGVAGNLFMRHISLNASVAFPGIKSPTVRTEGIRLLPAFNLTWNHRHGHVGMTHYMQFAQGAEDMKSSVDMALCLRGIDVFAEIAFDWKNMVPAGLAGCVFPLNEYLRSALMIRVYPASFPSELSGAQRSTTKCSNECSATLAAEFMSPSRSHSARLSVDAAYFPEPKAKGYSDNRQMKIIADYSGAFGNITFKARLSERLRDWGMPSRTDIRADLIWKRGVWMIDSRINLLHCKALSGLSYIEGAFKSEKTGAYLKAGIFIVDNWDDRIYVYERDAPGSFNVPAMYGRGVWSSTYFLWKPLRWVKVYASASYTSYLLMQKEKRKPGKAGLRLQCVFSF